MNTPAQPEVAVAGAVTAAADAPALLPAASPGHSLRRALAFLGPDFTLFLFFLAIFIGLGIVYGVKFDLWVGSIVIAVVVAVGLIAIRFAYRARAILAGDRGARRAFVDSSTKIIRDWGPLILLTVVFESLHNYTGKIREIPIDASLYELDVRLFGVEPTVWIGKFAHPLLTDFMALAYGLYFLLPMVVATALSLRGRRSDFREMTTAVVLHMCLGFLGFIVFPAGPPRFYAPLLHGVFQPAHLTSYFGLFEWTQDAWDSANQVITHSSFPSMHCALATLTLLYAWRFGDSVFSRRPRLFFWICLPLVISLVVSTIYLRHHWVPDCAAGIVLGLACFLVTPPLRRIWPDAARAASN